MDKALISGQMQPEESSAQIVRPKRPVQPPAYLKDFDLTTVRHRVVSQPALPDTTQHTQEIHRRCCREHSFALYQNIESHKSRSMGYSG